MFDKMLLKPSKTVRFEGMREVRFADKAETNVSCRKYDHLLKLLGKPKAKIDPRRGEIEYLFIGERKDGDAVNFPQVGKDETVLIIGDDRAEIYGQSEDAVSSGLKILIDMYRSNDGKNVLPIGEFRYAPKLAMRGVHMCIFPPDDGTKKEDTALEDLLRRTEEAALCGYNYIFLEFWGMFPYRKHPYAHWQNCYTREETEKLVSFLIDDLHVTPIPVQNLTSHAGWSRISSRKHVVLDRRPDLADMWIPGGWCFSTTREDTKNFLKDVIDDLITTFRNPPYLHCSCDKCFGFGSAEEERTRPADDLFVDHIRFLHDELQKRGAKMIMWSDMLYSSLDVKYWKCAQDAADRLPKDILMNIWTHNDIGESKWRDIDFFQDKGFETAYSPFLDRNGAKNMVRQCLASGSKGIIQTTWHMPETALETVIYTGGYTWTGEEPTQEAVQARLQKSEKKSRL